MMKNLSFKFFTLMEIVRNVFANFEPSLWCCKINRLWRFGLRKLAVQKVWTTNCCKKQMPRYLPLVLIGLGYDKNSVGFTFYVILLSLCLWLLIMLTWTLNGYPCTCILGLFLSELLFSCKSNRTYHLFWKI